MVKNPPANAGTQVRAVVREDPTCHGATKQVVHHNYWACTLEPANHNYWARAPRARALQQEKPPQWEARALQWRAAPARRNYRKPVRSNEDPMQPKINKFIKKKKKRYSQIKDYYCTTASKKDWELYLTWNNFQLTLFRGGKEVHVYIYTWWGLGGETQREMLCHTTLHV